MKVCVTVPEKLFPEYKHTVCLYSGNSFSAHAFLFFCPRFIAAPAVS